MKLTKEILEDMIYDHFPAGDDDFKDGTITSIHTQDELRGMLAEKILALQGDKK